MIHAPFERELILEVPFKWIGVYLQTLFLWYEKALSKNWFQKTVRLKKRLRIKKVRGYLTFEPKSFSVEAMYRLWFVDLFQFTSKFCKARIYQSVSYFVQSLTTNNLFLEICL